MNSQGYVFDSKYRFWSRPDYLPIGYSDGEELEKRILNILQESETADLRSEDLAAHVIDWPTRYHFSTARHNLLRPFCFNAGSHVLEIGSGWGGVTGYLAEKGAHVTALEGSMLRAKITSERCRDLTNVRVVCDNLMDFDTDQRFDFVTLIGVLEYAPCYVSEEDPIGACLERARRFLNPGGVLILAIENQLGLKYLNGCEEDHVGVGYYGLHGLYRNGEPTTFGRAELQRRLGVADLPHQRFFYPLPDYKLPQVILSDAACSSEDFDAAALLACVASGNAEREFHPNFHENLAWRPIVENGLLPHLANSFLVFAAPREDALNQFERSWIASVYTMHRISAYAAETQFTRHNNAIYVEKRRLHPDLIVPKLSFPFGDLLHKPDAVCNYFVGRPYLLDLQQRLGRGDGVVSVIQWALPWLDFLLAHSREGENGTILPGDMVDAIPQNFVFDASGLLKRIDKEWIIEGYVPLTWVVIRGLLSAIQLSPTSLALSCMTLRKLIKEVAGARGIILNQNAFGIAVECEARLQSNICNKAEQSCKKSIESTLDGPPVFQITHALMSDHHRDKTNQLEREISRVKSSFSWQITKPVRLFANLPRLVRKHLCSS